MRYFFEHYTFDTDRRELRRGPDVVPTTPQVFDLLDYLIRNRERVVSRDDLVNAIWKGRIVSDAALTTRLNAVRSVVGDTGEEQRLIKTLPRKGFRFVGAVREVNQSLETVAILDRQMESTEPAPPLSDNPSIAVLPFQNMSNDPGQEYFTDGIVEEIITGLSRMRWLSVIARNSSFIYKGRSVDVKQIGRELGVRYVLEGSVRKAGSRVRITGQLIDSITGAHLWADHFDGGLEDVFDLQDKVTSGVVGAIEPTVLEAELERVRRKPATSAWDYVGRAIASQRTWTREANSEALQLLRRALELDASLGVAFALASQYYTWGKSFGWLTDLASEAAEGARLARRALELGRSDPPILTMAGFGLAYLEGDLDFGAASVDRALELNPNYAAAWGLSGWIRVYRGEPDAAIEHVQRAIQLSPVDVYMFAWQSAGAYAHFLSGRYKDALSWAERALRERPGYLPAARMIVASAALSEVTERPQTSVVHLRELEPTLRISNLRSQIPYRRPEDLAAFADGLRKAGLPE